MLESAADKPMLLKDVSELEPRAATSQRTIVMGSGAVGLYAASELAKRGGEVIVLECGGSNLDLFTPESYACVGKSHNGIRIGRSKSFGGTTNLWGGQLIPFQPVDFSGRDWMPGSKWPVSYEEIAPYYQKTYENLGIQSEHRDDDRVWSQLIKTKPKLGEGLEIFLSHWLKIPSFAGAFDKQIRQCKNLKILTYHTAVGFVGVDETISGVIVIDRQGKKHVVEGEQFILAAGTIETVRLLLCSAATAEWKCPWKANDNLGLRFQDHLSGNVAIVHSKNKKAFFDMFCTILLSGNKYQPKIRLLNHVLEQNQIFNIQGMLVFQDSTSENLICIKQFIKAMLYERKISGIWNFLVNLLACAKIIPPLIWRYIFSHRIFVPDTSKILLAIQGEHMPMAESCIKIDRAVLDENGIPRVVLDWRVSGQEIGSIREFAVRCDRALQAAGLASLEIDKDLLSLNPQYMSTLSDNYHQAGGAVMGASPQDGVVDRNLRVFGTKNLYIGGAATFRTTGNANITLTALAFATRLVDHLTLEKNAVS